MFAQLFIKSWKEKGCIHTFPKGISEIHSAWFSILTLVVMSISNEDNHRPTSVSIGVFREKSVFLFLYSVLTTTMRIGNVFV